jgi:hypothetical protein
MSRFDFGGHRFEGSGAMDIHPDEVDLQAGNLLSPVGHEKA